MKLRTHILVVMVWIFSQLHSPLSIYSEPVPNKQNGQATTSYDNPEFAELENQEYSFSEQSNGAAQIDCKEDDATCKKSYYSSVNSPDWIDKMMDEGAAKILIEFPSNTFQIEDENFAKILVFIREVAKRDGQVSIEPIKISARDGSAPGVDIPLVGDLLQVSWDIYTRTYNYFKYRKTQNYNAKIVYHPEDRSVLYVYLVHKNHGDLCESLYSQCDVIEYIDDDIFDKTLSKRLDSAKHTRRPVRIVFHKTKAHLPQFELSLDRLDKTNSSLRLYKWFIASKETQKQQVSKERFLTLEAAVGAIKYSIKVYDLIKAIQMYAPANEMKAQVIYEGSQDNGSIQSVIFRPDE